MDTSVFYIYKGNPVAIVDINELVKIRHINRLYEDQIEEVDAKELKMLTHELAQKHIDHINNLIGECNMRIHAFNECLSYM
jgi:hypothetical protein